MGAISLEIFRNRLGSIAGQMGAALVRAAFSPNIKERKDCSCAIFDAECRLIAQAEHIPVHLGSMPDAVRAAARLDLREGDTAILNNPYLGGTHLPDLTTVRAWHFEGQRVGYTATRAHYADIGGSAPGSIPANSRTLAEDGLVISPVKIAPGGQFDEAVLGLICDNVRDPGRFRMDLQAQLASHGVGEANLLELSREMGRVGLQKAEEALLAYTETRMRLALKKLPQKRASASDAIETADGLAAIRVAVRFSGGRMIVDFGGTAPMASDNLNCPAAVTCAAVYFVARQLVGGDIPVNAGFFAPIDVRIPEGCLLNARPPAAVVGGNIETSQRVADVVQKALAKIMPGKFPAMSQGTMNNLSVGGVGFSFYETIGGGAGAGPDGPGRSGVQVGMTNTLNTPIEAIENEYPMRVTRYEMRSNSGGRGRHRGGDGIVREFEFLEPCEVSLLTSRCSTRPEGAPPAEGRGRRERILSTESPPAPKPPGGSTAPAGRFASKRRGAGDSVGRNDCAFSSVRLPPTLRYFVSSTLSNTVPSSFTASINRWFPSTVTRT